MLYTRLENYADRIEAELKNNILPFWMTHVVNRERGAFCWIPRLFNHNNGRFHGALTNDLAIDRSAPRGALLISRILWAYSAAYRLYRDPSFLAIANLAHDDLIKNFWDAEYGGFYWSITAKGKLLSPRKHVYGQAFAIYALSEYYRATEHKDSLDRAILLYKLLEQHALDKVNGGYLEALSRKWGAVADMRLGEADMNAPKSTNTHLHLMEAYTNLMRAWRDPALKASQLALVDVMLTRILKPGTGHLQMFFSMDWVSQSDAVSYGHDIEASWLLMEAAEVLGDSQLLEQMKPIVIQVANTTLIDGADKDGALFYAGTFSGATNHNKEWWPQAEAVVGFIHAYQISGDERYLGAALQCWDFIEEHLVDRKHGEWFRGVSRDGNLLEKHQKVSFWKCPYHNSRACMEASHRLRALAREI